MGRVTIAEWFVKFANRSTATSTLVSHGVSFPHNDQHHRIAGSDAFISNLAPAAIPVHAIVSTIAASTDHAQLRLNQRSAIIVRSRTYRTVEQISTPPVAVIPRNCDFQYCPSHALDPNLQAASWCCDFLCRKERKDSCGGSAKLGFIRCLRNSQPGGHFMSLPPRHAQLIRVDPCHKRFQMRFISARTNSMSTREASCLPVLTAAITRVGAGEFHLKSGTVANSGALHC